MVKGKDGAKEPEKPRVDPAVQAEEQVRSKARRQAILDLKTEIGETLSTLEQEVIAWETRIPGLLKSEEGKKIAANPEGGALVACRVPESVVYSRPLQSQAKQSDRRHDDIEGFQLKNILRLASNRRLTYRKSYRSE